MNFEPSHPRETILEALEILEQHMLEFEVMENVNGEPYQNLKQVIRSAMRWAHYATDRHDRGNDASPS